MIRPYILPFSLGFAAGFAVGRNWDTIREAAEPVARRVAQRAREALKLGRERAWEQRERVEDWWAELREENAAETQG